MLQYNGGLNQAMRRLNRALRFLVVALVFMFATQFLRFARLVSLKWALVLVLGVGVLCGMVWLIVLLRHRTAEVIRRLWPFVLKRTAMKVIEEQKMAERERMVFMKYDELFKELPAYEFSKYPWMKIAGAALIDEDAKPMAIKKFSFPRTLVEDDRINITI